MTKAGLIARVFAARNELEAAEQAYREYVYSQDWGGAELYKSDVHKHAYYQRDGLCVSRWMKPRRKIANDKT